MKKKESIIIVLAFRPSVRPSVRVSFEKILHVTADLKCVMQEKKKKTTFYVTVKFKWLYFDVKWGDNRQH